MEDYYNYSPNGFNIHREPYENVNESENVNGFDIRVRDASGYQNKDDYYPDYEKYSNQGPNEWDKQTKESQDKLNELKRTVDVSGTVINQGDSDVMDPNAFFNNTSQVYLLYGLGDELKK
jgi:hypothetical protein